MKLAYASLDEVPEAFRGICKIENGSVLLDETNLKLKADVDAVMEAKRKEVNDHNATKAKLAEWMKLGESPEALATQVSELQSRAGTSTEQTEKIATLQRDIRKFTGERDAFKSELDKIKPDYDGMKKQIHEAKISEVLKKHVSTLKGVDAAKLEWFLKKDVQLGAIDLDESGEGLIYKGGEKFEDYAMNCANTFGFKLGNDPGKSHPGVDKIPSIPNGAQLKSPGNAGGFLDDAVAEKLES